MIHKLTAQEYLKRYDNMTGDEKESVMARVGEWLKKDAPLLQKVAEQPGAHLQSVMQLCNDWDDAVSNAFSEGARLMSAFAGMTDTWLPDRLYIKAARRSIKRIVEVLTEQWQNNGLNGNDGLYRHNGPTMPNKTNNDQPTTPPKRKRGRPRKVKPQPMATAEPQRAPAPQPTAPKLNTNLSTINADAVIPRPQHIDQYIHLLPEDTQKRAAKYGDLMRDLGTARENMRLLMNDAHSTGAEREKWAKLSVRLDEKIGNLQKELDREWKKVVESGRVVVDELGMAHIIDPATGKVADPKPKAKKSADKPKEEKPKRSHHKKLSDEERTKRITYLQKWLRDARPAKTDEHRKLWEQNARELLRLGGNLTNSMVKAGEHYGAKIPHKIVRS